MENDLVSRDGISFSSHPSFNELYRQYGASWRITQEESLFDYLDDNTTNTYTDLTFPRARYTASNLSSNDRDQAEKICRAAGITDPILLNNCILDVGFTGDPSFAEFPASIEAPKASVFNPGTGGSIFQDALQIALGIDPLDPATFPQDVTYGEIINTSIDVAGETDSYSFQVQAGDVIRVRMTDSSSSSTSMEPQLELFDAQGNLLDSHVTEGSATVLFTAEASGTFYVLASDGGQNQGGNYGVGVYRLNAPADALPLALGDSVNTSIAKLAEYDAYNFQAQTGDVIRVRMTDSSSSSTSMEPQLEVFDAQGKLLGSNVGESSATVSFTAEASGTFYVLASDGGQNQGGNYGVGVYRLNAPADALPLALGDSVNTSIAKLAEYDAYNFQTQAGDIIRVRMTDSSSSSTSMEPQLEVFDAQGKLLGSNVGESSATVSFTAEASGTFYVLASDGGQNQGGNYGVGVYRLNAPADALPLALGDSVNTSIAKLAEYDAYNFQAQTGDVIRVRMTDSSSSSTSMEPQLEVFDAQGKLLGSNVGESSATVSFTAETSGTFYVLASDGGQNQGGNYGVGVYRLNAPADALPLALGDSVNTSIAKLAEYDAYNFQAQAGDIIRVRMTDSSSSSTSMEPQLEVFDAQGKLLGSNVGESSATVSFTAEASGTFYVLASDGGQNQGGNYTVSLEKL